MNLNQNEFQPSSLAVPLTDAAREPGALREAWRVKTKGASNSEQTPLDAPKFMGVAGEA
jgi:hypothetical protein